MSDDIIVGLVKERLEAPDCEGAVCSMVFPEPFPQAQAWWTRVSPIDQVLEIAVSDDEIIKRLSGRRVHLDQAVFTMWTTTRPWTLE